MGKLTEDRLQEIDNDACDRLASPDSYGWAPDITAEELHVLVGEVMELRAALEKKP